MLLAEQVRSRAKDLSGRMEEDVYITSFAVAAKEMGVPYEEQEYCIKFSDDSEINLFEDEGLREKFEEVLGRLEQAFTGMDYNYW